MTKNPLEQPPGEKSKKPKDWKKYLHEMEEASKRTKEIAETPEESAELLEAWEKLQRRTGPSKEKPPAAIRPDIVEKIRLGKKDGLNVLTPDEKTELYAFLATMAAETTSPSKAAKRFLMMLDPDLPTGIRLTDEEQRDLLDLLEPRA